MGVGGVREDLASQTWLLQLGVRREILILHSTRIAAELLRRQADASWPENPHPVGPADQLMLDCIGLSFPLASLYARTHLAQA